MQPPIPVPQINPNVYHSSMQISDIVELYSTEPYTVLPSPAKHSRDMSDIAEIVSYRGDSIPEKWTTNNLSTVMEVYSSSPLPTVETLPKTPSLGKVSLAAAFSAPLTTSSKPPERLPNPSRIIGENVASAAVTGDGACKRRPSGLSSGCLLIGLWVGGVMLFLQLMREIQPRECYHQGCQPRLHFEEMR